MTDPMNDDAWLMGVLRDLADSSDRNGHGQTSVELAYGAIQAHLQKAVVAARIDELNTCAVKTANLFGYLKITEYIVNRIAELQKDSI